MFQEGDIVRSYDFQHRSDCYMEGVFCGEDERGMLKFLLISWVSENKERRIADGQEFFTPPAGALFIDWEGRLELRVPDSSELSAEEVYRACMDFA